MTPTPARAFPPAGDAKRSYVRGMFTAIAPRYDLLNHVLSLNIDRRWRRQAVDRLAWDRAPGGRYLDLCAGTLDLAAELARRQGFAGRIVGADFVLPMLKRGRDKAPGIESVGADAMALPFPDARFDGCMVGFGVRNLPDLDGGLEEIGRVLKPGAALVILDFSTPTAWPMRPLYLFYFRTMLPLVGRLVSKHTSAYSYLPDSVREFPPPHDLSKRVEAAGFIDVKFTSLTMGISTLVWGRRGPSR